MSNYQFVKLKPLLPTVDAAFKCFYDEMLSSTTFSIFFSGPEAIESLIERQKKNFIESLSFDAEEFEQHFKRIGLLHYQLAIPYIDFVKGTSILKEEFVKLVVDGDRHPELVGLIYEYFRTSLSFMAKGYLDGMLNSDKSDIEALIARYESVKGDEQKIALDQLRWLSTVLDLVEHGGKAHQGEVQRQSLEINSRLQKLIQKGGRETRDLFGVDHLEDLHARLLHDTQSLFYFLERGSYTDVLPIYTGLLSIYKISLFLVSNSMVNKRLEEAREKLEVAWRTLEETGSKYEDLYNESPDLLLSIETESQRLSECNATVLRDLGYQQQELIGRKVVELFHPDSREKARELLRQCEQYGSVKNEELMIVTKSGEMIQVLLDSVARLDRITGKRYCRTVIHDISERKQMEEELLRAKEAAESASQVKSLFLANMSHELRTPLNSILGFSEMLVSDAQTTASQREKIATIYRSGEYLLGMINDVLDLSKIEAGRIELKPETIDLALMLNDIGRIFEEQAKAAQLRFHLEIDPGLAKYIRLDAGKLRQVLFNLLGNAVKFTREGGFSLRARALSDGDDPEKLRLQLEVEDSGPGIAPDQLQRIFEPFVQTGDSPGSAKGAGLGLSISKSFVEMIGGEITVDSTLGKGTLFHVELPVILAESAESDVALTPPPAVLGLQPGQPEWRILVVEDDPDNRLLLSSQLVQAGFEVREAENGAEGVELFKIWHPHFIWMDMRMPVMDGYQAVMRIRESPGGDQVKIAAITASVFKEQRRQIIGAGCDALVHKPFRCNEIFDTLTEHLGVRYRYATLEEDEREKTEVSTMDLSAELLAELTIESRQALAKAAGRLDLSASEQVIECIRAEHADIAHGLQQLTASFQFEKILALLKKVERESD
ncbi:MAG: ATP-binding protein [Candidatus Thiodiazotropha endolucinida]|nr:ATP-binding protein [Candidatus Thiodiazotropha taylori]MCW4313535.1 ATP-binding protein [Candidatus Thiodiazotropha taylori]